MPEEFSGEFTVLLLLLIIPKRRIDWSSGGGGETRAAIFVFAARSPGPPEWLPPHLIDPPTTFSLSSARAFCYFVLANARD